MPSGRFRFADYTLDAGDRHLRRDGTPVELNARYLDALILLVEEAGRLITKDRFLEEVWRGAPVTDEALTQCIKTLRRQLGDDVARPRFIETVPKHGYRFIAPVEPVDAAAADTVPAMARTAPQQPARWQNFLLLGGAGVIGGGIAGLIGGLFYGLAGAAQPLAPGIGAASVLLVLTCLTILAALIGAAGVSFGIAAANFATGGFGAWSIAGGAAGGAIVGMFAKLLGLDAFNLLFGQSPGDITGGTEGLLLGGAVGLGAWLGSKFMGRLSLRWGVAAAGLAGGLAGLLVPLLGGRMMGGSLELLARHFPNSRLRLDQIGSLFGENGFGPVSQFATGALEGLLFSAGIVAAMTIAHKQLTSAIKI
ncbi:MAG: winged helix-turn-helix domain-containing protein [Sphingosinicella sp.]